MNTNQRQSSFTIDFDSTNRFFLQILQASLNKTLHLLEYLSPLQHLSYILHNHVTIQLHQFYQLPISMGLVHKHTNQMGAHIYNMTALSIQYSKATYTVEQGPWDRWKFHSWKVDLQSNFRKQLFRSRLKQRVPRLQKNSFETRKRLNITTPIILVHSSAIQAKLTKYFFNRYKMMGRKLHELPNINTAYTSWENKDRASFTFYTMMQLL